MSASGHSRISVTAVINHPQATPVNVGGQTFVRRTHSQYLMDIVFITVLIFTRFRQPLDTPEHPQLH
ncbi:hypothetical protein CY34DRAFT_649933 [Suillus luteus UH-Slu-Lm8-n1]|uniref:Uncharacterized protein n=1 Tax=Suillus luteus UH-Slu-Lm8-n1 TaxID=930992 RepID=A0A0D0AJ40_9AGAM|nr:hypothetical protein CY34DRAFT_649933 [Suillus luteus UH-Slu-Lm8-n1]